MRARISSHGGKNQTTANSIAVILERHRPLSNTWCTARQPIVRRLMPIPNGRHVLTDYSFRWNGLLQDRNVRQMPWRFSLSVPGISFGMPPAHPRPPFHGRERGFFVGASNARSTTLLPAYPRIPCRWAGSSIGCCCILMKCTEPRCHYTAAKKSVGRADLEHEDPQILLL